MSIFTSVSSIEKYAENVEYVHMTDFDLTTLSIDHHRF